jgi:hypothetical protein
MLKLSTLLIVIALPAASFPGVAQPARELHAVSVTAPCYEPGIPIDGPPPPPPPDPLERPCIYSAGLRDPSAVPTKVVVDRPGKDVVLLLISEWESYWNVEISPGTRIDKIAYWGSRPSGIRLDGDIYPAEKIERYVATFWGEEGQKFRLLVETVPPLYGFRQLDSFQWQSTAKRSGFLVNEIQRDKPALRPDYLSSYVVPGNQLPDIKFTGALGDVAGIYDLHGTDLGTPPSTPRKKNTVAVPELGETFAWSSLGFSRGTGAQSLGPASNLPKIRFAGAAATYDSKRKLLIGAERYEGGHVYSYDPVNGGWAVVGEVPFELEDLAYDAKHDRYIAVSAREPYILKYDPTALRPPERVPIHFYAGLADLDRLSLDFSIQTINGDYMILVAQQRTNKRDGVGINTIYRIYLYDLANDRLSLAHYQN